MHFFVFCQPQATIPKVPVGTYQVCALFDGGNAAALPQTVHVAQGEGEWLW